MRLEAQQASVKCLQARDPFGDLRAASGDHPREFFGRVRAMARMAPTRDPGGVLEWDVQSTKVDEQPKVLDVSVAVHPVRIVPATRPRQPARTLVEPHGVGRDADLPGKLTDPHWRRKPWSDSDVKGAPQSSDPRTGP